MKKGLILGIAILLVVAFSMPALALENVFGGYWRTRMYNQQDFTGEDVTKAKNLSRVDTRTRLYYTAKINDDLKLVNKFEIDSVWGDTTLGDIGADGMVIEVKNSYADFNIDPVNFKIGIQGLTIARGFIMDDDFSGAVITYSDKDRGISVPFIWVKAYEGGNANNKSDVDYYGLAPIFNLPDYGMVINPFVVYAASSNIDPWAAVRVPVLKGIGTADIVYAGFNFDVNFDKNSKLWLTAIYEGGTIESATKKDNKIDINSWLAAMGGKYFFGEEMPLDIHGQMFFASGDDGKDAKKFKSFYVPAGQSYYWSEIMGYGIFDNTVSNNACADQISNVFALNLGFGYVINEDLNVKFDLWYAKLAEGIIDAKGKEVDYLGTEANLVLTYQVVKGLNLNVVGAYLFAGDATTRNVKDEANPYEIGTQLSLSF